MPGPSTSEMLATVRAEVEAELRRVGRTDDLCLISILPGDQPVLDYGLETCGGMAWVRLVTSAPTATFPDPTTDPNNCTYDLALTIEVGVILPAPYPVERAGQIELPSREQHEALALTVADDMESLLRAIRRAARTAEESSVGTWTPLGPDGGVAGGFWTFYVLREL